MRRAPLLFVRLAAIRGIALTSIAAPAAYLTGASLDEVGAVIALALAVYYAWKGK